jgi:hypothetical protein
MATGCVVVEGGAVELSWIVRDSQGDTCSPCVEGGIERVALIAASCEARNADGSCAGVPERVDHWPCDDLHGITGFVIQEGKWAFSIEAWDPQGESAQFQVPPPVIRDVVEGEPTQLDAWLIVSTAEDCSP